MTEEPGGERRSVAPWFERTARYSWGFLGIAGAIALIVVGIWVFRELMIPLVLAGFLAVVFSPVVGWLASRGIPRPFGTLLVMAAIAAVIVGAVVLAVVGIVDELDDFGGRYDEAQAEWEDFVNQPEINELIDRLRESASSSGQELRDGLGSRLGSFLDSAAGLVSGLVLGVVLLYYLLKDGAQLISRVAVSQSDEESAARDQRILNDAATSVRDYFRGRTALALVQGAAIGGAVAIMGVPGALSIAIVNFVGAYIPYIGAFVGGAFAFIMALSEGGMPLALGVLVVVLAVNLGLENLLEPRLVGTSLNMHPIVVLLATLAGGLIAGIVGLILAAPAVAIGYNLYKELVDSGFFDADISDPPEGGT